MPSSGDYYTKHGQSPKHKQRANSPTSTVASGSSHKKYKKSKHKSHKRKHSRDKEEVAKRPKIKPLVEYDDISSESDFYSDPHSPVAVVTRVVPERTSRGRHVSPATLIQDYRKDRFSPSMKEKSPRYNDRNIVYRRSPSPRRDPPRAYRTPTPLSPPVRRSITPRRRTPSPKRLRSPSLQRRYSRSPSPHFFGINRRHSRSRSPSIIRIPVRKKPKKKAKIKLPIRDVPTTSGMGQPFRTRQILQKSRRQHRSSPNSRSPYYRNRLRQSRSRSPFARQQSPSLSRAKWAVSLASELVRQKKSQKEAALGSNKDFKEDSKDNLQNNSKERSLPKTVVKVETIEPSSPVKVSPLVVSLSPAQKSEKDVEVIIIEPEPVKQPAEKPPPPPPPEVKPPPPPTPTLPPLPLPPCSDEPPEEEEYKIYNNYRLCHCNHF